jgi:hypothetical protein
MGKSTAGIIVIIPDAFGVDFINNQILADHYASAIDCLVYLPDFMAGKCSRDIDVLPSLAKYVTGNAAPVRTMINMAYMWDETVSWLLKP